MIFSRKFRQLILFCSSREYVLLVLFMALYKERFLLAWMFVLSSLPPKMMSMEVAELDSLAESGISAMRIGCVLTPALILVILVLTAWIYPPTLLSGNDGQVSRAVPNVSVVDVAVDNIKIRVCVGLDK